VFSVINAADAWKLVERRRAESAGMIYGSQANRRTGD
jgi:hypothetical protein